jgi:hypothetical protein
MIEDQKKAVSQENQTASSVPECANCSKKEEEKKQECSSTP